MLEKLKNKKLNILIIALAFSFNICFFAPLEFYYSNAFDLWFTIDYILPIIIGLGIIIFLIMLFLEKNDIINKLMFALFVCLYIQGNFLNIGYNVLNGSEINWKSMIFKGIVNTIVWIIIIIGILNCKVLKKEMVYRTFSSIISIFIMLIEIFTLIYIICYTYAYSNSSNDVFDAPFYMDTSNIYNLSKEENIIVFVSDTFEATYMNEILEKYPDYKSKLKDFIYFDNATTTSLMTYSSMPTILTGVHPQVGKNLKENMNYCFENTNFYNVLKENNYDIELYTSLPLIPIKDDEIIDNKIEKKLLVDTKSKIHLTELLYKCVLYRYMPHFLKKGFIVDTSEFNNVDSLNIQSFYADNVDDVEFNKQLLTNGLESNQNNKQFKLYHLNGVHQPYCMTKYIQYDTSKEYLSLDAEERRFNQAIASLKILLNYVEELKKANLYENTTIILLADHGWENRYYVNFMIKNSNSNSEFKISHAPISVDEDLIPTIMNIASKTKKYGRDIWDYSENESRKRKVYNYSFTRGDNTYKILSQIVMETNSKASDKESFYIAKAEYENSNVNPEKEYIFGKKINLKKNKNLKYCILEGFLPNDIRTVKAGTNIGKEASIRIKRKETDKDVNASIVIDKVYYNNQKIIFSIDDKVICEKQLNKDDTDILVEFDISKELWNKSEILDLKILFPNAELGNVDKLGEESLFMSILLEEIQFYENR